LKPLTGVIVSVKLAFWPGAMETEAGSADTEKSAVELVPTPLRLIVWGLVEELFASVSDPLLWPGAVGEKTTLI
jgi:hypothetical protein